MKPKEQCQRIHAKKRAKERFGIDLNRHEYAKLVEDINTRRAALVGKISKRIEVYVIYFKNGSKAHAIYDRTRKTIATFLPVSWQISDIDYQRGIARKYVEELCAGDLCDLSTHELTINDPTSLFEWAKVIKTEQDANYVFVHFENCQSYRMPVGSKIGIKILDNS